MLRTGFGLGVLAALLMAAGCRMCAHPYDYCGPVYSDYGCQTCSPYARAGSILVGSPEMIPSAELVQGSPEQGEAVSRASVDKQQLQVDVRPGDVPGSERIVSVTDRVVESPASPSNPSQVAAEWAAEGPEPSAAAKRWTARRPTPQVTR